MILHVPICYNSFNIKANGEECLKITIVDIGPDEEEEIIVRCRELNDELMQCLKSLRQGGARRRLKLYKDGGLFLADPEDIYYFESVDERVFAYGKTEVYEVRERLYALEELLPESDFFRAGKSSIVNLGKIKSVAPAFSGRLEATLKNGEKVIISRQYVAVLKEKLGI